jgi:hypothetical protein
MNNLLKAALSYAELGWPVLPLQTPTPKGCTCKAGPKCDSIGKHPRWHRVHFPHGVRSATTDFALINKWWQLWPSANIGIATGQKSFDVLDVDLKDGMDGNQTLDDFQANHGRLPDTPEQITGGGGRHILFRASGTIKNAAGFAPGLDTKTDGGYIVAAPSLHKSGRRYEWELSSLPEEVPLAPWPSWLLKIIHDVTATDRIPSNTESWELQLLRGVDKGYRDQSAAKLAGLYLQKGLRPSEVFFLLKGWNCRNRPPLKEGQIRKVVKSLTKIHQRDLTIKTARSFGP